MKEYERFLVDQRRRAIAAAPDQIRQYASTMTPAERRAFTEALRVVVAELERGEVRLGLLEGM